MHSCFHNKDKTDESDKADMHIQTVSHHPTLQQQREIKSPNSLIIKKKSLDSSVSLQQFTLELYLSSTLS